MVLSSSRKPMRSDKWADVAPDDMTAQPLSQDLAVHQGTGVHGCEQQ